MAGTQNVPSSSSLLSIGNCKVHVKGRNFICETLDRDSLQISLSNDATITVSVKKGDDLCSGKEFLVINPKDVDDCKKDLLQEVLQMYMDELPAMKYAANTGKESLFLERCVSNGKYCTLLLKSNAVESSGEVIAAFTYQIIPADTQYAEVPLAVVRPKYQHMGLGHLLYLELRKRLRNVGVSTILCWGDKESEGFWFKQGFEPIAEVDSKGKACRLPLKAAIQKALCFPGGSTLMVSHTNKDILASPSKKLKLYSRRKPNAYVAFFVSARSEELCTDTEYQDMPNSCFIKEVSQKNEKNLQGKGSQSLFMMENGWSRGAKHFGGSSLKNPGCKKLTSVKEMEKNALTVPGYPEKKDDAGREDCTCSGVGSKKRAWQASCSSLKSKKVKGGHDAECHLYSTLDVTSGNDCRKKSFDYYSVGTSSDKSCTKVISKDLSCTENKSVCATSNDEHLTKGESPKIMLMDIADDVKKSFLKKIIEDLGGTITSDGNNSTHVITGKSRKTFNFCTAICSGAWVISPNWLKASSREGKFIDELPFILHDGEYQLKYKSELKDAVLRGKTCPRALFKGYDFCIAKHVEPPVHILLSIVKSAGGNVLGALDETRQPSKTIFIASDIDMETAMLAAEKGLSTYGSDWFMRCVMKQEIDLNAPQFAESL